MKFIRFVAFLFYRYYRSGRYDYHNAYLRTVINMGFLVSFHIFHLFSILQITGAISKQVPGKEALVALGSIIPVSILFAIIIKEKKLKELDSNYWDQWDMIFNARAWLIVYMILSFSAIWILQYYARR